MRPSSGDEAYLWDMREAASETLSFVEGVGFDRFLSNRQLQRAVERELEIIGEAASRISHGFREAHPEIPWRSIIGQRNVLAHEYGEVMPERVWGVLEQGLPALLQRLTELLASEGSR